MRFDFCPSHPPYRPYSTGRLTRSPSSGEPLSPVPRTPLSPHAPTATHRCVRGPHRNLLSVVRRRRPLLTQRRRFRFDGMSVAAAVLLHARSFIVARPISPKQMRISTGLMHVCFTHFLMIPHTRSLSIRKRSHAHGGSRRRHGSWMWPPCLSGNLTCSWRTGHDAIVSI